MSPRGCATMPAVHSGGLSCRAGQHLRISDAGARAPPRARRCSRPSCASPCSAPVCRGRPATCTTRPSRCPARLPGTVIWAERIPAAPGYGALRVMYHSRDAENRDRAVTGTIYYPTDPTPPGGWPVVSWAHGTSGLSSSLRAEPQRRRDRVVGPARRRRGHRLRRAGPAGGAARVPLRPGRGPQRHRHRPRRPPDPVGARRAPVGHRRRLAGRPRVAVRRRARAAATRPSSTSAASSPRRRART